MTNTLYYIHVTGGVDMKDYWNEQTQRRTIIECT